MPGQECQTRLFYWVSRGADLGLHPDPRHAFEHIDESAPGRFTV